MATNGEVIHFGERVVSFLGAASALVMPHLFPDGARESGVFADVRSVEEVGGLSGYAGGAGEFQSAMRCSAFARRVRRVRSHRGAQPGT